MRYDVFAKSSFKLVRNASPRGPMCFRCLIFSLSGPYGLLFLLCFIAFGPGEVVTVMLYPCIFCVALLMYLFVWFIACLTVYVNCLVFSGHVQPELTDEDG